MFSLTFLYLILSMQIVEHVNCLQVYENTTQMEVPHPSHSEDDHLQSYSDLNSTSPILYPGVNKSVEHKAVRSSNSSVSTTDRQSVDEGNNQNVALKRNFEKNTSFSEFNDQKSNFSEQRENSQLRIRNSEHVPENIVRKEFIPSPEVTMGTISFTGAGLAGSDSFQPISFPDDTHRSIKPIKLSQIQLDPLKVIPKTPHFPFQVNHFDKTEALKKHPQSYGFLTNLTEETKSMLFDKSKKKYTNSPKKISISNEDEESIVRFETERPLRNDKDVFDDEYFLPETKIVHESGTGSGSGNVDHYETHSVYAKSNKNIKTIRHNHPYEFENVNENQEYFNGDLSQFNYLNPQYPQGVIEPTKEADIWNYESIPEYHNGPHYLPPSPTAPMSQMSPKPPSTLSHHNDDTNYPTSWDIKNHRGKGVIKSEPWRKIIHILSTIIPIGLLLSALTPNVVLINPNTTAGQLAKPIGSYNGNINGYGIGLGTGAGIGSYPQRQQRTVDDDSELNNLVEILEILQQRLVLSQPRVGQRKSSTDDIASASASASSEYNQDTCKEKIFCELLNAGILNKNGKFQKLLKKTTKTSSIDEIFSEIDANQIFRAAKESNCSSYTCDSTAN